MNAGDPGDTGDERGDGRPVRPAAGGSEPLFPVARRDVRRPGRARAARRSRRGRCRTAGARPAGRGDRARFEARRPTDADRGDMLARVEAAFAGGQREVMLVSFPSDFCTDAGRRINDRLPGRQDALPAGARAFLAFWRDAPRPGGFGPGARVRSSGRATPTLRRTTGRSS